MNRPITAIGIASILGCLALRPVWQDGVVMTESQKQISLTGGGIGKPGLAI